MAGTEPELSDEQKLAVEPHVRHIEAGPGAGKTKTMVARFRARASPIAGIALLSFTNAAINVARSRCLNEPHLLESPNFVGTFDSFFHRYVVTPAIFRTTQTAPRYLRSWDDLPDELGIVRNGSGTGIRLSRWVRQPDGSIQLDETLFSGRERGFWGNANMNDWRRNQIRETGTKRIEGLLASRTYDAAEGRRIAFTALQRADLKILARLALRFSEIIVDEFQDCDDLEHQLLALLTGAGIHVVTIADPDQAIYEFRQLASGSYQRYVTELGAEQTVPLTTCYRSTPAICALVTSLRQVSTSDVVSNDPAETPCSPIQVVVGDGASAGTAAARLVASHGIAPDSTRFIAHKKRDGRVLARSGDGSIASGASIGRILSALAELRSGSDARTRHAAINRMEKVTLDLFDWGAGGAPSTRGEQLERLGITGDQLRMLVSGIITAAPGWSSREDCAASIRTIINEGAKVTDLPLIPTLNNRLAKPTEDVWNAWVVRSEENLVPEIKAVRWTHVHAVKGDEFDAVIYGLPTRTIGGSHVLNDWEQGANTEARRVLYVGVSRARLLVVFVVPPGRKDQLLKILDRDGIPYQVTG